MNEDRRVQKTRQAIQNAFVELITEKNYPEITVKEIADRAKNVLGEAETLIAEVREIAGNTGTMVENANTVISEAGAMIEQNTGAVTEAVQKLNGVDFEKLNEAIRNLNDAVAPLGALARNLP